jgi:hypothetical protein
VHLLHRYAAPTYAAYRSSARTKLKARFEDVRAKHEELVELEGIESDRRNARALKEWAENAAPGWGLEEKTQVLDQVLSAAWKLSEPGGRYARLVKRFERWLEGVNSILEARRASGGFLNCGPVDGAREGEDMFIAPLDPEWKAELQSLSRKLEQWRNQLLSLGDAPSALHSPALSQESSLALVVRGIRDLVQGMGDEVRAMEGLERSIVVAEEGWIREAIGEDDEDGDEGRVAGAVWRIG